FSAVLTAFVIDSYEAIRLDPNGRTYDTIIYLLSLNTLQIPISPTPASIFRVKVFWFTSLVLSLSAATIGVVVLQWLRSQRTPTTS
ncbi:hypothetical protein BDZ97DRAFT_1588746, partial [Flammula alnicola]